MASICLLRWRSWNGCCSIFFLPFIAFAFIGIPLALVAVALAFYPVNNRPFSHFLEAMFNFTFRPKRYLWRKERSYVYHEEKSKLTNHPSVARRPLENQELILLPLLGNWNWKQSKNRYINYGCTSNKNSRLCAN